MKDVAALAQVSPATVSRVLNGTPVDPKLARRVRTAVERLNYRPSSAARSLRTRRTRVWGLIISDVRNPFFTDVVRGIEDAAQQAGYALVLCNSDDQLEKERAYVELAIDEQMAGVILSPASPAETDVAPLLERGVPVVAVDRSVARPPVDTVAVDNVAGARAAVEHLLAEGFERVACLTGPDTTTTGHDRFEGYRQALLAGGLESPSELIVHADFKEAGGAEGVRRLLGLRRRPDAVLIGNSVMALGALAVLRDEGVRVPEDVGLVCFDDAPWASLTAPTISAVAQPTYALGFETARLVLARIGGDVAPPRRVLMATELRVRQSSRRSSSGHEMPAASARASERSPR